MDKNKISNVDKIRVNSTQKNELRNIANRVIELIKNKHT